MVVLLTNEVESDNTHLLNKMLYSLLEFKNWQNSLIIA